MEASSQKARGGRLEWAAVFARWLLGGLFIYLGLVKALHPVDFLKLVHQYDLVRSPFLLNSIAAALPWFEVFCGLLVLFGIAVRGTALVMLTMLVPFTLLILRRALDIAAAQHIPFVEVKFDCGCGNGEVFIWKKLIENTVLTLIALFLTFGGGRRFAVRFSLCGRHELPGQEAPESAATQPASS